MTDFDTLTVDGNNYATKALTDGAAQAVTIVGANGTQIASTTNGVPTRPGSIYKVSATASSLTTATTLYTTADQLGSAMQFSNVSSGAGGFFRIVGIRQRGADANLNSAALAIYDASPTGLAGDNAPWVQGLNTAYLGNVLVTSAYNQAADRPVFATGAGAHIWGVLIVTGSPAASHYSTSTSISVELIVQRLS